MIHCAPTSGESLGVKHNNARDLTTISFAFLFAFLGAGAAQPFVIDFLHDGKGLPMNQASLVLATVYFTFVVFRFFIGFLIDLLGLHLAKIIGIATYAVFPFLIYRTDSFPALLAAGVLWGIGAPLLWTSAMVQVMNTSSPTRFAGSTGIVRGGAMIGHLFGLYLLSLVYRTRGYESVFLLAAALGVAAVLAMVLSPNRPVERKKPQLRTFFRIMRSHQTKAVAAMLLCSGLGYGVVLNGLKAHIEATCGPEWLEDIMPFFFVAAIVACFLGGRICDLTGRWPTFGWAFALGAAGMWIGGACTHPVLLMGAMVLVGIQNAVVPLAALGWIGDVTSPEDRPSVMGYILCFRELGVAIAILIGGVLRAAEGAAAAPTVLRAFAVASLLCAATAFLVAFLTWPRRGGTRA